MAEAPQDLIGRLFVFGVNHRSATAGLRERLMAEDVDQAAMLGDLAATGIAQAVLLATCDRLEVVGLHSDPEGASAALEKLFAQRAQTSPEEIAAQGYRRFGEAALRHVFAVAASLDSQVTGEPQVLGQVKDSHRAAAAAGTMSAELETVLQAAYAAAKRVRSETAIAERPVSIASAALMIARNLHGDLTRRRVLLVGLGEMAELMAQELKDAGMTDFMVVHTSAGRAEATAHRLQGHFRPWSELAEALVNADIAVTSLGSGRQCVTTAMADGVLRQRKRRPILFIDTAIPGDVEPGVGALDGAFVYDLGDLESVAREGKASRDATAAAAWKVLDEELTAFLQKRAERGATPAVAALRRHFESVRNQVLAQGNLDAEAATRLLVKRLLHDPSEALRAAAARAGSGEDLERTIARLFRLEDWAASAEEAPEEEDGP